MIGIKTTFMFGQIVYLKTDTDQTPRMLTGLNVTVSGHTWRCSAGTSETWHYEYEFTTTKNVLAEINKL